MHLDALPVKSGDMAQRTRSATAAEDGPEPRISAPRPGAAQADDAGDRRRDSPPGWPPRDVLAPFVLLAVSMRRAHGYAIEEYLRTLGLFGLTMSTVYRTLRQMEKDGLLASTWEPGATGPARRVYALTDAGRAWLDTSATMLSAYRNTIDRFFGLYGGGSAVPADAGERHARDKE